MKPSTEIWPPPPMRPHLAADTNDDNWLTANDLLWEITWRDSAIVIFAALWLLLACFAVATHHHSPRRAVKHVLHLVHSVLP